MADKKLTQDIIAGRRASGRAESSSNRAGDPALRRMQRAVGNEGLRQQMNQGNVDRGFMLSHIGDRLRIMHEIQNREVSMTERGPVFDWSRAVARGKRDGVTGPDPSRWHETARKYDAAAEALCRGDMTRGHALLDDAMAAENKVFLQLSSIVDLTELGTDTRASTTDLDQLVNVGQLRPIDKPADLDLAKEILSVTAERPDTPGLTPVGGIPWWEKEEEEEEEEDGDDAGGT